MLKIGNTGDDVLELQRMLIGWRSRERPMALDGEFGTGTDEAVRRFQDAHDIEPDGITDEITINALQSESARHPFDIEEYKCTCGECGGFGLGRFENEYRAGKPEIEAYCKYEYPGIDLTVVWAIRALMHRAEIPSIRITSGYRCWNNNERTGRTSTNHMGKAVDFISLDSGEHNGSIKDKIECTECARIRSVGIEQCGFQPGWRFPNRISFEMPHHGAYTWVHIDSRCIAVEKRRHVKTI